MSENPKSGKILGAGILTAVAASLCCITPVLALISGVSGIAAAFTWIEPLRPYLIGFTVLVLGFAWYQKVKPKTQEEIDCDCEVDEKPSFWQSKKFLGIVTTFALLMLAFPSYSHLFYSDITEQQIDVPTEFIANVSYEIEGMTCTGCEEHIKHAVKELDGVLAINADYENSNALVKYDDQKISEDEIIAAINATGYTVVRSNVLNENPIHGQIGHICSKVDCGPELTN